MRTDSKLLLPLALLGGCHSSANWAEDDKNKSVHLAVDGEDSKRFSVEIPGVDAKLALPALDLSRHIDLDGMKMAPGTNVRTLDVSGHDDAGGRVLLSFTSSRPPAVLVDYYREAATRAGYGRVTAGTGGVDAVKGAKHFVLAVSAEGQGSRGTITVGDRS